MSADNAGRKDVEVIPSAALEAAASQRAALLRTFEDRRLARAIPVPTSEEDIRAGLRSFGLPICLFGEDLHDRRERLRAAMAAAERAGESGRAIVGDGATSAAPGAANSVDATTDSVGAASRSAVGSNEARGGEPTAAGSGEQAAEVEEEFYVEGSDELRAMRLALALPSLQRARSRLAAERDLRAVHGSKDSVKTSFQAAEAKTVEVVRGATILASQIGDARPLSAVAIGPCPDKPDGLTDSVETNFASGWLVATGSWSGLVKLWSDGADARLVQSIDKHSARVSSLSMPRCRPGVLLTSSADTTAQMYVHRDNGTSMNGPVENTTSSNKGGPFVHRATFDGHSHRVSDCQMHPFRESLVITSSFDGTFILHDDGRALLTQKTGHAEVHKTAFHPDGSLVGTCGGEGGVRLWDLRSGRAVMTMAKAHVGAVTCLDFSGDGRVLATGGGDNMVKIWDLRGKRCAHGIPAHVSIVSGVKFAGGGGDVVVSCSFDRTVKVWTSRRGWALLKSHAGHEDKVTAVDVTPDAHWIVSACYDRTFKLWGPDDIAG